MTRQTQQPLLILPPDRGSPSSLVYNLSVDATIAEARRAIEAQLGVEKASFDFVGSDGRTALHSRQEALLRIRDVWGAVPEIHLCQASEKEAQRHSPGLLAKALGVAGWPLLVVALPVVIAALAIVLSLCLGLSTLMLAHITHTSGHSGERASAVNGPPDDDYQRYLDTFLKVWQASLDALVVMISTYLNGPVMSIIALFDHVVEVVEECVMRYLEVFYACFIHAVDPTNTVLLVGMTVVAFGGTALLVHVIMRDLHQLLSWSRPTRGAAAEDREIRLLESHMA